MSKRKNYTSYNQNPLSNVHKMFDIYSSIDVSCASTYSKIRIALDHPISENNKRICSIWPYFGPNISTTNLFNIKEFRQQLPVKKNDNRSIDLFPISKSEIDELPKKIDLDYDRFNLIRDYFEVKRFKIILNSYKDSPLSYSCYNKEELPIYDNSPWNSSNEDDLKRLFDCWGFFSIVDGFKVKLPSFYGKILITDFLNLDKDIRLKPIEKILSKNPGKDKKTIRYYVLTEDIELYEDITDSTEKNMRQFIKDKELVKDFEQIRPEYLKRKEERKVKFTF